MPGFEGRWLAGLAPVGNTAYVFVVQTRASTFEVSRWKDSDHPIGEED